MIDRTAKLSAGRQAKMLEISQGSVYYKPRPVSDAHLKLVHRIGAMAESGRAVKSRSILRFWSCIIWHDCIMRQNDRGLV